MDALPPLWILAVAFPAVTIAYMIFSIAGFGAVFITAPALAQAMPVSHVVPVLSLVDFGAAAINGTALSRKIAFDELKFLIPLMIVGSVAGIYLLLIIPGPTILLVIGDALAHRGRSAYATVAGVAAGATVWGYAVLGQANDLLAAGAERVFTDMATLHQLTFT